MEDPVLNTSLEETRELQTRWSQFHDFCQMAIKGQSVTAQAEMKFLELKSRIAMLHDSFMAGLKHSQKTGQNIMQIVSDCILLKRLAAYSGAEKQKFEFDWNEVYLLINEQISTLEDEQKRLASISERAYRASRRKQMLAAKFNKFIHGAGFKFVIGAAVLFMVFFGIPYFEIYNYRNFGTMSWSRGIYQKVVPLYRMIVPDFAYESMAEVSRKAPATYLDGMDPNVRNRITQGQNRDLTAEYFRSRVLVELGATAQTAQELTALSGRALRFESERWTADDEEARFFFVLMPTTDDAKQFIALCNRGVATLPADRKETIRSRIYVARKANLILIGISMHSMRASFIQDVFYLKNSPPSLLQP